MPTYCFKNPETGEIHDHVCSCKDIPKSIDVDGVKCERCIPAEISAQSGQFTGAYPIKSYALAVPAWKAKEFTEKSKELGVPTEHDKKGRPIFRSRGHRKKYAELRGATDFDGGYSDPDAAGKEPVLAF